MNSKFLFSALGVPRDGYPAVFRGSRCARYGGGVKGWKTSEPPSGAFLLLVPLGCSGAVCPEASPGVGAGPAARANLSRRVQRLLPCDGSGGRPLCREREDCLGAEKVRQITREALETYCHMLGMKTEDFLPGQIRSLLKTQGFAAPTTVTGGGKKNASLFSAERQGYR